MYICILGNVSYKGKSMDEDKTYFAPSKRSNEEEILIEFEFIKSQKFFKDVFGSIAGIASVIDIDWT